MDKEIRAAPNDGNAGAVLVIYETKSSNGVTQQRISTMHCPVQGIPDLLFTITR
jgi:hypothetical protein